MASKSKIIAELFEADGDIIASALDNVVVTPTAISDQPNTSTGGLSLPAGTTAQRPSSPDTGESRYNSSNGSLEFYDGSSWIATNLIPTLDSVSGNIYVSIATSLTLTVSNATDTIAVVFKEGSTTIATVTGQSVSSGSATVAVPSAVYGQTVGDTITISIQNTDGTPSSNSQTKTVVGLPTGGTRTISGSTVYHSFSSGTNTLAVPSGFSSNDVDVLIVAAGGGGGCGNGANSSGGEGSGGGGGGAGGLVYWGGSESAFGNQSVNLAQGTNYSIVVGTGGTGAQAESAVASNGGNSTAFGFTALGGGGASSHETTTQSRTGGSGGGAHDRTIPASGGAGIQFSTYNYGYGNNGGGGQDLTSGDRYECGAGGGGAGAVGQDCNRFDNNNTPGTGGAGKNYSSVFGTTYGASGWFAGGGGGGGGNPSYTQVYGDGGTGGGGRGGGGATGPSQGTDGTGSGGGGGQEATYGADGGDGIVLVKYTIS
jgi:hypothetical protein